MRVLWLQNVPIIALSHHKAAVQLQRELFPMQRSLASACQRQYSVWRVGHLQAATLLCSESGPNLNLRVPVTLEIIPSAQFQGQDTQWCPEVQIKHISGADPEASLPVESKPTAGPLPCLKVGPIVVYLPKTMINQFKYYPKCHSGWEAVNFLQVIRHATIFPKGWGWRLPPLGNINFYVNVCLFSQFLATKIIYIEA